MSGKKSRNKGANFERQIAKILSDWSGYDLRRTPLSGGWAKGSAEVAGDLVCVSDNVFPLHVECKNQEGWTWESVLTGQSKVFDSWVEQAYDDCPINKIPCVVFKKNYGSIWIAIDLCFVDKITIIPVIFIESGSESLGVTTLESFLENWTVHDLRKRCGNKAARAVQQGEG